ncbi:MAG: 50S ribosomal protein L21 [Balneolaceae bacterium]|nr:50S ribosomal protein L21 [Balneolaceae bacterium]
MYAVVEIGGHQYRVSEGDVLFVDRQHEEAGNSLTFDRIFLINDGNGNVNVGKPTVEGASIEATLLDNVKADKVIVFKKKRRKGYKVKRGHRQPMSQIEINEISTSGSTKTKKKKASKKSEKKETKKEAKSADKVSTDMTAKEAIAHIKDTPLKELKGFVPKDEERVTVQRAWDSKQED